jgi:hypothetical protein
MAVRFDVIRLLKAQPFRPFLLIMDSGQRIGVRHPENVAYDPTVETANCYALSDGVMHILPWEKISSVALVDRGDPLPSGQGPSSP